MGRIGFIVFYLLLIFLLSSSSSTMKSMHKSVRKEKELMKTIQQRNPSSESSPTNPLTETEDTGTLTDELLLPRTVVKKTKKKKTKKRKVLPKLNWWSGVYYFLRSVGDPTCAGFIKCSKSPRLSSSMDEGMMMTGTCPSFGPVCGPNGCF